MGGEIEIVKASNRDLATAPTPECPVCATAVTDDKVLCSVCETPHHRDCWEYAGGCAIFACAGGAAAGRTPARADPVAAEEFDRLGRRAMQWFWIFRFHWAGFGIIVTSFASLLLMAAVGIVGVLILPAVLLEFGAALAQGLAILFSLSLVITIPIYLALILLGGVLRASLEAKLKTSLAPPGRRAGRALLDRLDPPVECRILQRFGRILAYGAFTTGVLAGIMLFVLSVAGQEGGLLIGALFLSFVALAALTFTASAVHLRTVFLASVQNRLIASFKRSKH